MLDALDDSKLFCHSIESLWMQVSRRSPIDWASVIFFLKPAVSLYFCHHWQNIPSCDITKPINMRIYKNILSFSFHFSYLLHLSMHFSRKCVRTSIVTLVWVSTIAIYGWNVMKKDVWKGEEYEKEKRRQQSKDKILRIRICFYHCFCHYRENGSLGLRFVFETQILFWWFFFPLYWVIFSDL